MTAGPAGGEATDAPDPSTPPVDYVNTIEETDPLVELAPDQTPVHDEDI